MHISPALVTLQTLIYVTDTDTLLFEFDGFHQLLKTSVCDGDKEIRKSNLWNEVQHYHYPSVKTIKTKKYLSFESIIRYCFNHVSSNKICRTICKEVTDSLLSGPQHENQPKATEKRTTILELYQNIAENSLLDSEQLDELQCEIQLLDIPSLYTCYREEFPQQSWNKISLFEWHFHSKHPEGFHELEDVVKAKWTYYDQCMSSEKLSFQLRASCDSIIETNRLRREASACMNSKRCEVSGVLHIFGQLEKAVMLSLDNIDFGSTRPVCMQCGDTCKSQDGVHMFVELGTNVGDVPEPDLQNTAFLLQKEFKDKHKLFLHEVVFLVSKTLDSFKCGSCPENSFHRYELYHAFVGKKLLLSVINVSRFEMSLTDTDDDQPETTESSGNKFCNECTKDIEKWIQNPLDWMSFSLFREWHLFLPLPIQILFTGLFLNKRSICRSQDSQQLFQRKIQRLYSLLDIGLNTLNHKHCGVVPEMTSAELLFNHQSASTVFALTNEIGISQSLKTSVRWLQTESDIDNCFYKTFMKKYPLRYKTAFEEEPSTSSVGMKDCFVILGLDNLVRLTTHADPNPGENRTSQLCTIPMTLKGLPKDCSLVTSWHSEKCEPGEFGRSCDCMRKIQLETGSEDYLFKLLPQELKLQSNFDVNSTWGLCRLWSDIEDFIIGHIHEGEHSDLNDLNQTMESLKLGDENKTPVEEENRPELMIPNAPEIVNIQSDTHEEAESLEFPVFQVPPLLTRHPKPAVGRDDDKAKLREILLEMLQSLGRFPNNAQSDRILLAPDHKLSKNLIQLMKEEPVFQQFLPEFPVLHLKKSKILNIFSAYKDAGLHELLQYMKDDEHEKDWKKLITFHNIETAAKNIKRLALAFHIAFLTNFLVNLPLDEQNQLLRDMESNSIQRMKASWAERYEQFMILQSSKNATFAFYICIDSVNCA